MFHSRARLIRPIIALRTICIRNVRLELGDAMKRLQLGALILGLSILPSISVPGLFPPLSFRSEDQRLPVALSLQSKPPGPTDEGQSLIIAMDSAQITKATGGVVRFRAQNKSTTDLPLGMGGFYLVMGDGDPDHGLDATGYYSLLDWVKDAERPSRRLKHARLPKGASFECEIDLTKLKWNRLRSSYREWLSFGSVPSGSYRLFFESEGPIKMMIVEKYRSNELRVIVKR